ncbi:MAG: hypothetical protein HYT79_02970 [Elusimicrobia bacterium]|nr:hypothetical protein [Elusimicrobiota bacterium]
MKYALLIAMLCGAQASAQQTTPVEELERRIDILSREVEKLKLGDTAAEPAYQSAYGFAPAAAKVYHINRGVSIGGYGEMTVQDFKGTKDNGAASGKKREADFLRAIVYTGFKFTDRILFNSEIEFEHATTGGGAGARGEASLEFAYLDFFLAKPLAVRAGLLLVPVGFVNELHEPTIFHGSRRPNVESNIIPTTWRENGAGLFGELGPLSYRTYVMTGLQAVKDADLAAGVKGPVQGFSASSVLRNARSKGAKSQAEDLAWIGRLDYKGIPGILLGGSFYSGQAGQNNTNAAGEDIDAPVTLSEMHGSAEYRGVEIKALYAQGSIGDAADINTKNGLAGNASVGERFYGGYAQAAYDVLSLLGSKQYLAPFIRYEKYDTQQRVPGGFSRNPANKRTEYTYGLTYKPHPNTVIKADWQNMKDDADTGVDQFNLAVGYLF